MTTQKLSSEKLFDFSLFKNLMRRRLSHILVAFLVTFFTTAIPLMMIFQNFDAENVRLIYNNTNEYAANSMRGIMSLNLMFSYVLAVYFGIISLGYMMKRRSAHFYHALPQRRETLYFTSIASALFCAAIGAVISVSIATAELFIFNIAKLYPLAVTVFFKSLVTNLVAFITTYAITILAGTVSGNKVVQTLMTLVILFYPIVTYLGILIMRMINSTYFNISPYVEKSASFLSPVVHILASYGENELSIVLILIALVVSVLLIVAGLFIYKKRPLENSESPIVFKKLGHVLKYMFMFTITTFSGLFFFLFGGNIFSMIFGFVSGAVLSFMLFNTILEKSPKAMFKGANGLAIFAAAFAVYFLVICIDIFNIDDYIPSKNNISKAEITLSIGEYEDNTFDDPEILAALVNLLENQQKNDKKQLGVPTEYAYYGEFQINTVMYTKLGIPISRTYYISKFTEGVDEFLELYANDPRMQKSFDNAIENLEKYVGKGYNILLSVTLHGSTSENCSLDEFFKVYTSELNVVDYSRLSTPAIGSITVLEVYDDKKFDISYDTYNYSDYSSIFYRLPIYEDMKNTIAFLEELTQTEYNNSSYYATSGTVYDVSNLLPADELNEEYVNYYYHPYNLSGHKEVYVNINAYPQKGLSPDIASEILTEFYKYQSGTSLSSIFVPIDKNYVTKIVGDSYEHLIIFPKGKVPEEIKALF